MSYRIECNMQFASPPAVNAAIRRGRPVIAGAARRRFKSVPGRSWRTCGTAVRETAYSVAHAWVGAGKLTKAPQARGVTFAKSCRSAPVETG